MPTHRPVQWPDLGQRVRLRRETLGLSQTQLGFMAGMAAKNSQSAISLIERGKSRGEGYLPAIAKALDVPTDWLVTGRPQQPWEAPQREHDESEISEILAFLREFRQQSTALMECQLLLGSQIRHLEDELGKSRTELERFAAEIVRLRAQPHDGASTPRDRH